jgi:hypothetical protein
MSAKIQSVICQFLKGYNDMTYIYDVLSLIDINNILLIFDFNSLQ